MADKALAYLELSDHAAHQITSSFREWTGFLGTVADYTKIYAVKGEVEISPNTA